MSELAATGFYFFPHEYYDELRTSLVEQTRLVHAVLDDKIIASSLFFIEGERLQYHLSGTLAGYQSYSPTRVILEDMRRWGHEQGLAWMHLGGGVSGQQDSLFKFKAGFAPTTCDFSVGKVIVQPDLYSDICAATGHSSNQEDQITRDYFPLYRAPV